MPINWTEVEAIANSLLVLTSASAIGYAGLQLKHERDYRAISNLEKQLGFFLSESHISARKRLANDRLLEREDGTFELRPMSLDDAPAALFEVLDFYEHQALLVKKGHLNVYDVWHTFYEWAQPVYVDAQPLIEDEEGVYAGHYSDLRRLIRDMDEIQMQKMHQKQKNANHWSLWTPDRIIEHYRQELETGGRLRRNGRRARHAAPTAA